MANNENNNDSKLKNEVKQKAKNKAKATAMSVLTAIMPFIVIILIILVIASSIYAIITKVIETIKNIGRSIINFFVKLFGGGSNEVDIPDEEVDRVISQIESTGIDYADLGLLGDIDYSDPDVQQKMLEAKRKYTKMFIKAQLTTRFIKKTEKMT